MLLMTTDSDKNASLLHIDALAKLFQKTVEIIDVHDKLLKVINPRSSGGLVEIVKTHDGYMGILGLFEKTSIFSLFAELNKGFS